MAILRRKGKPDIVVPKEYIEQRQLITGIKNSRDPRLVDALKIYANPNGGSRGDSDKAFNREGLNLKLEGVTPGVPDLTLPVPRAGYHGLYLEMKRVAFGMGVKWGTYGPGQVERIRELRLDGYCAMVGAGHVHAENIIRAYLLGDQGELDKLDRFEAWVSYFQKQAPKSLAPELRLS